MKNLLTILEAANELNLSRRRVQTLITDGRLPAEKLGNQYVIKRNDLDLVRTRTVGRPPKAKEVAEVNQSLKTKQKR